MLRLFCAMLLFMFAYLCPVDFLRRLLAFLINCNLFTALGKKRVDKSAQNSCKSTFFAIQVVCKKIFSNLILFLRESWNDRKLISTISTQVIKKRRLINQQIQSIWWLFDRVLSSSQISLELVYNTCLAFYFFPRF